jgi:hypothetical protein
MRYYVSIADVPDKFLEFLGYLLVAETEEFKVYLRHGDLMPVKKGNPYLYVDDLNDARILQGHNLMAIPPEDGD